MLLENVGNLIRSMSWHGNQYLSQRGGSTHYQLLTTYALIFMFNFLINYYLVIGQYFIKKKWINQLFPDVAFFCSIINNN